MARQRIKIDSSNACGSLRFLYGGTFGRILLKVLTARFISVTAGIFLSSRLSVFLIKGFVKKNNIDLSQYEQRKFCSYNDFFTRRILPGMRVPDSSPDALISPCDAKLCAYSIDSDSRFDIKGSVYSLETLLKNESLAKDYYDGICLIFRLSVDDYHRYCYIDDGVSTENVFIKGVLHTVQPIAIEALPVFSENCREYTVMSTRRFGQVIQMEVGALLVGKIDNNNSSGAFSFAQEKGKFLFGGSTIILLLKKDSVNIDDEIFSNTNSGYETFIKMGEKIGTLHSASLKNMEVI